MDLRSLARRVLDRGISLGIEATAAAAQAAAIARSSGVLRNLGPSALGAAIGAAAAGEHAYGVLFALHAQARPDRAALVKGERTLTYRALSERYHRASQVLEGAGLRPGERLIVMMGNQIEYVEAAAAAGNLGATFIPVAAGLTPRELAYIVEHAQPRVVVTDAARLPVVQEVLGALPDARIQLFVVGEDGPLSWERALAGAPSLPIPPPADRPRTPGLMVYTSGTTGRPKGVERADSDFSLAGLKAVAGMLGGFGMSEADVFYTPCPLYHSAPIFFLSFHLALGATVVLGEDTHAEGILDAFRRHGVTDAFLVPTLLARLARHEPAPAPGDFPALRALYSTAARLPVPVAEAVQARFGPVLHDFYGATETGIVTLATPSDLKAKPGSVGRVLPGAELYLLDEDGREVQVGETGELYARTGLTMTGYRRDDAATRAVTRRGCFTVGDLATRDVDGYVYIVGRRVDMIITGGVNVYPAEIEEVLHTHPAVAEVAVVGIPDPDWGEVVHAVVVPRGAPPPEEELRAWAEARLSRSKQPRFYHFREQLPHSPQGKILKRVLRLELTPAS